MAYRLDIRGFEESLRRGHYASAMMELAKGRLTDEQIQDVNDILHDCTRGADGGPDYDAMGDIMACAPASVRSRMTMSGGELTLGRRKTRRRSMKAPAAVAVVLLLALGCVWLAQETPVQGVEVDAGFDEIAVGGQYVIDATVTPSDATYRDLMWTCDNPGVTLTPTSSGAVITAGAGVADGSAVTVTAKSDRYGISDSVTLTVVNDLSIEVSAASSSVSAGGTATITSDSVSRGLETVWSTDADWVELSSNGSVATASVGIGATAGSSFTVTARLAGTSVSDTVTITVDRGLGIVLSSSSDAVVAGEPFEVSASFSQTLPEGTVVSWSLVTAGTSSSVPGSGGVTYTADGDTLRGTASSSVGHGVAVTVTASVASAGASASIVLYTVNTALLPTEVSDAEGLSAIRDDPSGSYVLTADIELSGLWRPFEFTGVLDGNGHTVSGLSVSVTDSRSDGTYRAGLFTVNRGTVKDLTVSGAAVTVAPHSYGKAAYVECGAVCGVNYGTISGCRVTSTEITAHSTDIKTSWIEEYGSLPTIASASGGKSGTWYEYASLRFTGTLANSWAADKAMEVRCGGIAGTNGGTITGCGSSADLDAQVVNFNYNSSNSKNARVYVGGIAGYSTGGVVGCNASGTILGSLVLHDSGSGSGDGLGFVVNYVPAGKGYAGGLCGYATGTVTGSSTCSVDLITEAFAPMYAFLSGSYYATDKGKTTSMSWSRGVLTG